MKIVSWNCCHQKNGFTDKKRDEILKLNPDILMVQECKEDDWLKLNYTKEKGHWYGDDKESQGNLNNKHGIGIFCNDKYSIDSSLFCNYDLSNMRYALPYIIKHEGKEILTIFSVWSKAGYKNYQEPIFNALKTFYKKTNGYAIVIGDFNTGSIRGASNAHWYDKLTRNFAKNNFYNCADKQEWIPTFFKGWKSWLDDHCFATSDLKTISFGIGNSEYWRNYSDHCPISVEFDI